MADRQDKAKALMAKCGYGGSMGKMRADGGRTADVMTKGAYSKPEERKRGGSVKHKGATVNVLVAPQGGGAMPHPPMPAPMGPAMSGPVMPPGAAPGMPPGLPVKPPGMMKRGGGVKMNAGAGGASGRMEKVKEYG